MVVPADGGFHRNARTTGRGLGREIARRDPDMAVPGGGSADHRWRNLVGGATKHPTRRQVAVGGVAVVLGASAAAWAVGYPQTALAATVVRALADCAGVVTLGLTAVPMLDVSRYRGELIRTARAPLAASAGVWLFAELCRLVVGAAGASGVP